MRLYLSLLLLIPLGISAQDSLRGKACIGLINGNVKAYIANNIDSTVKRSDVRNGFKLLLNDTTYKVEHFFIVFEHGQDLVSIVSDGDKISPSDKKYETYLNQINPTSLLTVESIVISKKSQCYKISPLVYQIKE